MCFAPLVEAVVGPRSPLVGMTAREAQAQRHQRSWGEFAVIAPRAPLEGRWTARGGGDDDDGADGAHANGDANGNANGGGERPKRGTLKVEDFVEAAEVFNAGTPAKAPAPAGGDVNRGGLREGLLAKNKRLSTFGHQAGALFATPQGKDAAGRHKRHSLSSTPALGGAKVLHAGDVLLVEAGTNMELNWIDVHDALKEEGGRADFTIARTVANSKPPRVDQYMDRFRVVVAVVALATMVSLSAFKVTSLLVAALLSASLLIAVKAVTVEEALGAVKGRVLLAIVTTFGVGTAFQKTGAAHWIAQGLIDLFTVTLPWGPAGALLAIALVASIVGCVVSNNAVVILMYPICATIAEEVPGVNLKQLLAVLMVGASSSFLSPVSYQTNLMVMKPGNYKFLDYTRFGFGLQIAMVAMSVLMGLATKDFYADE